jgi:hypothetical protein
MKRQPSFSKAMAQRTPCSRARALSAAATTLCALVGGGRAAYAQMPTQTPANGPPLAPDASSPNDLTGPGTPAVGPPAQLTPPAPVSELGPAPPPGERLAHEPLLQPIHFGAIAGVGFPRPLAVEAMVELGGYVALGAEYGVLPAVTIDDVDTSLWSLAADVRFFPFRGAFFLGLRTGRQHVSAATTVTVPMLGSANEALGLDSWFLNPRAGFLWRFKEGLTLGVEAGVQIPVSPTTTSSLPLSLDPAAARTIDSLGKTVLPTVDLIRIGFLL